MRSAAAQSPRNVIIYNYTFVIVVHQERLRWSYISIQRERAGRQADRLRERETDRQTDRHRQRDRETETERVGETEREGERERENSKSLIPKESSTGSIWTYLKASPRYTINI